MNTFQGQKIFLKRTRRKSISVRIDADGILRVTAPMGMSEQGIAAFLREKSDWICTHMEKVRAIKCLAENMPLDENTLVELKRRAQQELPSIVSFYAQRMNVSYGKITIRSQKGRWGSCSTQGNLSFNCLLMLAPVEVQHYVVVHELAHRKQMNHSAAFWHEVEYVLPDYRTRAAWLKQNGELLIARMQQGSKAE